MTLTLRVIDEVNAVGPAGEIATAPRVVNIHGGRVRAALRLLCTGRVRVLGVTRRQRLPAPASIATAGESRVPDYADAASFSAQIARELETERDLVRRFAPAGPR
jgi:hypothetical protein